jgi:hypothetical protein
MAHEVALLIPGEDDKPGNHHLILTKRPAQSAADQAPTLQQISYIHPLYPTLHYVLLYALSDPGRDFSIEFQNNGGIRKRLKVSAQVFYRYLLYVRSNEFNTKHKTRRMFQQWVVDILAAVEKERLDFLAREQPKLDHWGSISR